VDGLSEAIPIDARGNHVMGFAALCPTYELDCFAELAIRPRCARTDWLVMTVPMTHKSVIARARRAIQYSRDGRA
jgi:hypothetical protein